MTFNELKKLSKTDTSGCPKLRAALLGDTATQFLAAALKGMSAKLGMNLDLFEADFNQVESLLSARNSELEKFGADFIIVFQSSQKLLEKHLKIRSDRYYISFVDSEGFMIGYDGATF